MLHFHGAILTAGADLSSEMLRNGLACCEVAFLLIDPANRKPCWLVR
jgi:hypothetical protein